MPDYEETVILPRGDRPSPIQPILLEYWVADGPRRQARFSSAVLVGRGEDCTLRIAHPLVSRHHLAIAPEGGRWWARDLESSNGTLVAGQPIAKLSLEGTTTLELGTDGPRLKVTVPPTEGKPQPVSREHLSAHYFGKDRAVPAGEHTLFIRRAFVEAKRRHRRLYLGLSGVFLLLLAIVGSFSLYQYRQIAKTNALANDIFYAMKDLELQIANLETSIDAQATADLKAQITDAKRRLAGMRERYDAFVKEVQAARLIPLDSEEKLILHIARVFGETEVDVPDDFLSEVRRYIQKWKASTRLERAIRRLNEKGYGPTIHRALTAQGLPPQFLYLALQETNFQPEAVGPPTRYGHAKGMWQFIPSTAKRYGLEPGPLQQSGLYDPNDDRHDVAKATEAAARYLKDIYRTDAQASGLLVMASYNWGEGNIIKRVRAMPENPRERNFWQLLRHHDIPKETYDYVFYIFSAAVIGENPRLFGFGFDNPLQSVAPATKG